VNLQVEKGCGDLLSAWFRYTRGPLWQSDGPKFGMPPYTKLTRMDARTRIPFDFMYKVNASPLILRRSTFLRLGMFNQGFSCPGQAGITFDFEYSIRMWKHNAKVRVGSSLPCGSLPANSMLATKVGLTRVYTVGVYGGGASSGAFDHA
jgi:hypothetical protein